MVNNVGTPNRMANNIGMQAKAAVGETEDSMICYTSEEAL